MPSFLSGLDSKRKLNLRLSAIVEIGEENATAI
jgi:hypothetical protein